MKRYTLWSVTLTLLAGTLACNMTGPPPTQEPTITAISDPLDAFEEATPLPTHTVIPTFTAIPVTSSPTPTGPPPGYPTPEALEDNEAIRVSFNPGAVSATIRGYLLAGGIDEYVLYALEDQVMTVVIDAPGKDVFLTIAGVSDGQLLIRSALGQNRWAGVLPASQDYAVYAVSEGDQPAAYTLTIDIAPLEAASNDCLLTVEKDYTAYSDPALSAPVFGTIPAGEQVFALARTPDGWIGFDPGIAQAGNSGLDRLRWFQPDFSLLAYSSYQCDLEIAYDSEPVLNLHALENQFYLLLESYNVTLENGRYEDAEEMIFASLLPLVVYGDLNGDGVRDAAAFTVIKTGGSGSFVEMHAVLNKNNLPTWAGATFLGDRISIVSASYQEGIVTLNLIVQGPDDPFCCPTQAVTVHFGYEEGVGFREVTQ